jgi:hypothetical protein
MLKPGGETDDEGGVLSDNAVPVSEGFWRGPLPVVAT